MKKSKIMKNESMILMKDYEILRKKKKISKKTTSMNYWSKNG